MPLSCPDPPFSVAASLLCGPAMGGVCSISLKGREVRDDIKKVSRRAHLSCRLAGSTSLRDVDDAQLDGLTESLRPAADSQLLKDVPKVELNRGLGKAQF